MELALPVRGLILGFSIAAAFGPIGVLCLRRTLVGGFALGLVSGLGAATADAAYASVASVGVSAVSEVLLDQRLWLRVVGGLFLVSLGLQTARATPPLGSTAAGATRLVSAYASTLALTISNPMTILSFIAIGLGNLGGGSVVEATDLVAGVFVGSAAWWLMLASVVSRLRSRVTSARLRWVNIASGLLIFGFGVQSLALACH